MFKTVLSATPVVAFCFVSVLPALNGQSFADFVIFSLDLSCCPFDGLQPSSVPSFLSSFSFRICIFLYSCASGNESFLSRPVLINSAFCQRSQRCRTHPQTRKPCKAGRGTGFHSKMQLLFNHFWGNEPHRLNCEHLSSENANTLLRSMLF